MASYRVREGSITASDSFTNLGSLYGQATTSSVQVPAGASAIVGMIVSVSHDSATNGAATFAVQLTGDGLTEQQTLTVGSAGVDGTPASNGMTNLPFKCDVAIPVTASNQVSIAGAMDTDIGTAQMSVCLIFA
jgi:maltoporin